MAERSERGGARLAPVLLPRVSRSTVQAVQVIVMAVPALVVVVGTVLILLVALFMSQRRQEYALQVAKRGFTLAATMTTPPGNDTGR